MSSGIRLVNPPTRQPPAILPAVWEKHIANADVSKSDLDALVLDYLLLEGFGDAAISFAKETGLSVDIDPQVIEQRMTIKEAVEDGRVEEAVRRVNELDPELLDMNAPLLFHLYLLRLIEYIKVDDLDSALQFATNELAPRGAQHPELLGDLEKTMALLAFPDLAKYADDINQIPPSDPDTLSLFQDPAFAPIIQLMKRAQRVKVARELNSAILESQGSGTQTKLTGLVKLMVWGEQVMETIGVGLPTGEKDKARRWADHGLSD